MRYIALLRGINVGGHRKVDMRSLKALFIALGYVQVTTHLNSGNVIFTSDTDRHTLQIEIQDAIQKHFGEEIPVLIKTQAEVAAVCQMIPGDWRNDAEQKTDVAFLFDDADTSDVLGQLPVNPAYIDLRYSKGAVIWHVLRENHNKSRLNKIVGTPLYQQMTVRNVNTVRFLAGVAADSKTC